ncbi:MAG: SAM-dependent chlorinase/fluorinase [Anaerolineae bacterium]|nr:SAM-dependent chlorinase/fluorinase [Anaerolineae bacterium]
MSASLNPIITLTTDFGQSDGYVGAMQGVILTICPSAKITHLTHNIPPQNIRVGAFVLYQTFSFYPSHTVHCVVIDPGVGSERRAIAVQTREGIFVGPDNGVLSLALAETTIRKAVVLTNPTFQVANVSDTFHGRDIFSPAAAHLAKGVPIDALGDPITDLVQLDFRTTLDAGQARIIHVDHFGNLVLDLRAQDIDDPAAATFTVGSTVITSLSRTFADVEEGELLAYTGSTRNHIEIAVRNGNAAQALDLQQGDVVQVSLS